MLNEISVGRRVLHLRAIDFIRGFPKVDHSGIYARIVLEQINSAKKLPLTGLEPSTLGLSLLFTSCLSCLTTLLDPIA